MDEILSELMGSAGGGWVACSLCGAKVKYKNIHEHMVKVHPMRTGSIDGSKPSRS
jgi:hypothetical protein